MDDETGDILAVFTSAQSWTRCGRLEIRADFGEAFDLMVMLCTIALYEKAYRSSVTGGGAGVAARTGAS